MIFALPKNLSNKIITKKNVTKQNKNVSRDIDIASNQDSSSTLSQGNNLCENLSDDEYMRSKLMDKIRAKLAKLSTAAESTQFNEQHVNHILGKLQEFSLRIIRNERNIVGVCSCYCGSQLKLNFEINKKTDSGYWKLWNLERHLKSHINKSLKNSAPINGKYSIKYLSSNI